LSAIEANDVNAGKLAANRPVSAVTSKKGLGNISRWQSLTFQPTALGTKPAAPRLVLGRRLNLSGRPILTIAFLFVSAHAFKQTVEALTVVFAEPTRGPVGPHSPQPRSWRHQITLSTDVEIAGGRGTLHHQGCNPPSCNR
jgi:hypothetical protein